MAVIKEYRTVSVAVGPLMLVEDVQAGFARTGGNPFHINESSVKGKSLEVQDKAFWSNFGSAGINSSKRQGSFYRCSLHLGLKTWSAVSSMAWEAIDGGPDLIRTIDIDGRGY